MNRSLFAFLLFGTTLVSSLGRFSTPSIQISLAQTLAQTPPLSYLTQSAPVDFSTLRSQLRSQNWQAADAETRRILQTWVHPNGDVFSSPLASNIPPEILQTLDRLWIEASNGRFGFSVQRRIWEEAQSQHPNNTDTAAKAFGDRVGWTRPTPNPENFVSPDWLTEPELNYSKEAPAGHLPWAGIDWERIDAMLNAQSCGSCMIDAIYLQGERFNRYLPVLFNWLTTALESPLSRAGSWQQASLAYSIDLRTLYANSNPNNSCPVNELAEAISPDSTILAISSYSYERSCGGNPNQNRNNSTLAIWNAQRGNRIVTLLRGQATESFSFTGQAQEPPTEANRIVGDVANAIAFTPDSRLIAAGLSNATVRLWTTDKGEAVRTFTGHQYAVRAIAISKDGQLLVSASADQTIKLWNLKTGQLLRTIRLNSSDGIAHTVLISPDGQRLATATQRNTLQLWNAQTGQIIRTFTQAATQAADRPPGLPIAFSPDGQILATADRDRSVKLWNAATGARMKTLSSHTEDIQHLAFSPDGTLLASTDAKNAHLWNLQTYQSVQSLDLVQSAGHPVMPNNLAEVSFSPDGKVLATSTLLLPLIQSEPIPQQGITLWEVATGHPLKQIHEVAQFQFSPNGQFFMANGQSVQIWQPYRSLIRNAMQSSFLMGRSN